MVVKATKNCLGPFGKSYVRQRKQGVAVQRRAALPKIYVTFWPLTNRGTSMTDSLDASSLCAGVGAAVLACVWQG